MRFGADESLHSLGNLFSRTVSRFQMPELGTSLQYKWPHQPGGSNTSFPLHCHYLGFLSPSVSPLHPTPHSFPTITFWYCRTNMEGQWRRKKRKIWGRKKEHDFISHSFCPFCTLWHLTLPSGSKGVCGTLLWQHKRSFMIWCWPFFFF